MGNCIRRIVFCFPLFVAVFYQASVTEAEEDKGIVFCFVCRLCRFSGFVYAIAPAACEFLYRKNNEYYEIKKKKKKKK